MNWTCQSLSHSLVLDGSRLHVQLTSMQNDIILVACWASLIMLEPLKKLGCSSTPLSCPRKWPCLCLGIMIDYACGAQQRHVQKDGLS